mmetsp:Transcript_51531/g.144067  ORF Transcript_51531/g.144067 Transcript_51531/m.144067 type:complete len:121 (-) Transcript_51531:250-612(-)
MGAYRRKGQSHKVIKWFWNVVESLSPMEQRRLLQFATGSSQPPALGFGLLTSNDGSPRRFTIESIAYSTTHYGASDRSGPFIRAHTCFNKLDLPEYLDEGQLRAAVATILALDSTGFTMD